MAITYLEIGIEEDALFGSINPLTVRIEQLIPENHEFLMGFLDYDLSKIEQPLKEYLTCLDSGKEPRGQLLTSVVTELQQMHPYFLICRENAAWLLNRVFAGYIMRRFDKLDEAEQKNLFLKVCVNDYSSYTDPDMIFDVPISSGDPHIVDCLYALQQDIRTWAFLTIDNTNPALAVLNGRRRSALYSQITSRDSGNPVLLIETAFSTAPTPKMQRATVKMDFIKGRYEKLTQELQTLLWNPEAPIPPVMQDLINATRDVDDCDTLTYNLRDFSNLLELEIYRMINSEKRIKRCRNCGKYFMVEKSNQEYCSRLAPNSTRLCSEIGRTRVYGRKKTGDTSPSGLYRKAYKTHFARVSRGSMGEDAFEQWKVEAREKLDQVNGGELDAFEFEEWLKL